MFPRRFTLPFFLGALRLLPGALLHARKHRPGTCSLCGAGTLFLWLHRRGREMPVCVRCLGNSRHRHTARAIVDTFAGNRGIRSLREALPYLGYLRIYEAQSDGALHSVLAILPGYVCSEYFDGVEPGEAGPGGIRCEDLQRLTFPDESFDLVVTQDVLEHVRHPLAALAEIRRVLRPGGHHIFTVPLDFSRPCTVPLVDVSGPADRLLGPPVYHKDSIRLAGALTYNEFGTDLLRRIDAMGMSTRVLTSSPEDGRRNGIYDSAVFVSRKTGPDGPPA